MIDSVSHDLKIERYLLERLGMRPMPLDSITVEILVLIVPESPTPTMCKYLFACHPVLPNQQEMK